MTQNYLCILVQLYSCLCRPTLNLSSSHWIQRGKSSESVQSTCWRSVTHAQTWASYSALYRFGSLSTERPRSRCASWLHLYCATGKIPVQRRVWMRWRLNSSSLALLAPTPETDAWTLVPALEPCTTSWTSAVSPSRHHVTPSGIDLMTSQTSCVELATPSCYRKRKWTPVDRRQQRSCR